MQHVLEHSATKSLKAYLIISPTGQLVGKIIAAYGKTGACTAGLWDWTDGRIDNGKDNIYCQAKAGGYGYDKLANILGRMTFNGQEISEGDWRGSIEKQGFVIHCAVG